MGFLSVSAFVFGLAGIAAGEGAGGETCDSGLGILEDRKCCGLKLENPQHFTFIEKLRQYIFDSDFWVFLVLSLLTDLFPEAD